MWSKMKSYFQMYWQPVLLPLSAVGIALAVVQLWNFTSYEWLFWLYPLILLLALFKFGRSWNQSSTYFTAFTALMLVAFVEIVAAMPLSLKAYAVYGLVWSVALVPLVFITYSRLKAIAYVSFLLTLVLLWAVPWNSRKPFLRDLYSIKPGMTVGDVDQRMKPYMRSDHSDPPTTTMMFRHSNSDEFGADIGFVHIKDGRVSKVEFGPD